MEAVREERRKRKKGRAGERDRTREEKPTNDWSNQVPEWYRARPIGTVDHVCGLVPFIDQAPGLRGPARERIGRSLSIHPFSALPSCPLPPSRETSYANAGPWRTRNDRPIIRATWNLEPGTSALFSRKKGETFGPAEYSLEGRVPGRRWSTDGKTVVRLRRFSHTTNKNKLKLNIRDMSEKTFASLCKTFSLSFIHILMMQLTIKDNENAAFLSLSIF